MTGFLGASEYTTTSRARSLAIAIETSHDDRILPISNFHTFLSPFSHWRKPSLLDSWLG